MSRSKISRHFKLPNTIQIESASIISLSTKEKYKVEQYKDSYCLCFEIQQGQYQLEFRFDYSKMNKNNDPTLDLQIFKMPEHKELFRKKKKKWHWTYRNYDAERRKYIYKYEKVKVNFDLTLNLQIILQTTKAVTCISKAYITQPVDKKDAKGLTEEIEIVEGGEPE